MESNSNSATTAQDNFNVDTETFSNSNDHFNMQKCEETLTNIDVSNCLEKNGSDDEYIDAKDNAEDFDLDDENIAENHKDLSEEQLQKLKNEAIVLKDEGNTCFKKAEYKESVGFYTRALNTCPLSYKSDRSILYANRAAARVNLDMRDDAILDCNRAIELNPEYLKAILRRAQLHRKADDLERSLEDFKKILEMDPNNMEAREACATMPAEIAERNEKMKDEMLGKLKELGNMCLKPFGLSTENFKMVQDPKTGGYSVNFQGNSS